MWSFENLAFNAPTLINQGGEEVWFDGTSNIVLIRLKPKTKSDLYHHFCSTELYSVIKGEVRFYYGCTNTVISTGQSIVISPPHSHQAFNDSDRDAIIIGQIRIPWEFQLH